MKFTNLLLLLLVAITLVSAEWPRDRAVDRNKLPYKVVCYWGTWAYYRPSINGKFEAERINPNLCTHINYGFAKLDASNRIALYDPDLDVGDENWNSGLNWGHGMIRRMNELRNYNPNLATMISIGGWNEGSNKYSVMVRSASTRRTFIDSVVKFLIKYEFDGLDFDWEYPGMKASGEADRTPGRDEDKEDYVLLLEELREAFEPYGFLLTAAVSAGKPTIDRAYDIPKVSQLLHFINLMTYDFHGGWDKTTGHNSPLYPLDGATGIDEQFTMKYAVDYWIERGADPKKIILGIGLYGRTFTLKDSKNNGIGAPVVGKGGSPGPITRIIGMLGYNEICSMVKNGGWEEHWNETQQVPYATKGNQWVGYDNIKSVQKKVNFLLERKLGGGMIWSIDTDDFTGHCGDGKYPLLKTISRSLNNIDGPDVEIPRTHATTPRPSTSKRPEWDTSSTTRRPEWSTSSTTRRPEWTTSSTTRKPITKSPNTQAPITQEPNTQTPIDSEQTGTQNSCNMQPTTIPPYTQPPTTQPPSHPSKSGEKFNCTKEGYYPDPVNPKKFHYCVNMGNYIKDFEFTCAGNSVFNSKINVCGHPNTTKLFETI